MQNSMKIKTITQASLISAIVILMAFTPIGFLKIGFVDITFITIPVTIGAMIMGRKMSIYFGALFGAVSFIQCFGFSPFGVAILAIDPIMTLVLCFVPRILMAVAVSFIYEKLKQKNLKSIISSIAGPALNTILFVGIFWAYLPQIINSDYIKALMNFFEVDSITTLVIALFAINGLVEVVVCGIAIFAVSKVLLKIKIK